MGRESELFRPLSSKKNLTFKSKKIECTTATQTSRESRRIGIEIEKRKSTAGGDGVEIQKVQVGDQKLVGMRT